MISLRLAGTFGRFALDFTLESTATSLGLFGPSGAGKTSVLESLAGWRPVSAGHARVAGRTLFSETEARAPSARGIGYVPQDLLLFPHLTVLGNVRAGHARMHAARGPASAAFERRVLEVLELEPLLARTVLDLSGGERQRVALARALCSGPHFLLLDEPLGALDEPLKRRILPWLVRVREEFGVPWLVVSHDVAELQALCAEVAVMAAGRVVAQGPPAEVLFGPVSDFENVLTGTVRAVDEGTARVELRPGLELVVPAADLVPGRRALIGVRANDPLLASVEPRAVSARNVLAGRVVRAETANDDVLLTLALGPGPDPVLLRVAVTPAAARELGLRPGGAVQVILKTHSCRVLASL